MPLSAVASSFVADAQPPSVARLPSPFQYEDRHPLRRRLGVRDQARPVDPGDGRSDRALAHQARATSGLKLRQPLRKLVVEGAPAVEAHAAELASEVRVKEVEFGQVQAELRVKPNLPVLGPRLGKELRAVQQALQGGEFEELDGGRFRAAGHERRRAQCVRRGDMGTVLRVSGLQPQGRVDAHVQRGRCGR